MIRHWRTLSKIPRKNASEEWFASKSKFLFSLFLSDFCSLRTIRCESESKLFSNHRCVSRCSCLRSNKHCSRFEKQQALWVKSGNRGNLKCLNVNNHFTLIFYQKYIILFLSDAKLPKVYDWFLGLIIHVKYLRSYLQKTWRGGLLRLKFCMLANLVVPRKKVENTDFHRAPLHGANIYQIFL